VDQLALPYRIALVGMLAVIAVWFVFFRAGAAPVSTDPAAGTATAPGVTGLSNAVDKARGVVDTANGPAPASVARSAPSVTPPAQATPATPATPSATPKAAMPKAATPQPTADPSAPVLRALQRGDTAVVLFYKRNASDDLAVRAALRHLESKRVYVKTAPVERLADYDAITTGVKVGQSPTVLVIGKDRRARTIVGITDAREVDQLIGDVRHDARGGSGGR
jgi:hypothetical protein